MPNKKNQYLNWNDLRFYSSEWEMSQIKLADEVWFHEADRLPPMG